MKQATRTDRRGSVSPTRRSGYNAHPEIPHSGELMQTVPPPAAVSAVPPLAGRLELIAESITLAVTAKANALKKAGVDVVTFGAGEPDFDTPVFIKEAAVKALMAGKTKYEPTPGTPEARKAIADKL